MKLDDEIVERPWDAVRVAPHTVRAFEGGPAASSYWRSGPIGPRAATVCASEDFWPA